MFPSRGTSYNKREAKELGISFIGSGGEFAMIDVNAELKREREKKDLPEGVKSKAANVPSTLSLSSSPLLTSTAFADTALSLATPEQLQQHFVVTPGRLG